MNNVNFNYTNISDSFYSQEAEGGLKEFERLSKILESAKMKFKDIDNVYQSATKLENSFLKNKLLFLLSKKALDFKQPKKAFEVFEKINLADCGQKQDTIRVLLYKISESYIQDNKPKEAASVANLIPNCITKDTIHSDVAKQYLKNMPNSEKSLEEASKINDPKRKDLAFRELFDLYLQKSNYKEAFKVAKEIGEEYIKEKALIDLAKKIVKDYDAFIASKKIDWRRSLVRLAKTIVKYNETFPETPNASEIAKEIYKSKKVNIASLLETWNLFEHEMLRAYHQDNSNFSIQRYRINQGPGVQSFFRYIARKVEINERQNIYDDILSRFSRYSARLKLGLLDTINKDITAMPESEEKNALTEKLLATKKHLEKIGDLM